MRRFAAFSASAAAMAGVSSRPTPTRITRPREISPVTAPSTVTLAWLTRWITARIGSRRREVSYEIATIQRPTLQLPGNTKRAGLKAGQYAGLSEPRVQQAAWA